MVGKTIAHYQITEKLGEGGMGVVYKARDTHLDRFVAIKVLPPERVADPSRKARFVREAKAASALNHPNIITIHDINSDAGHDFIVMEYVAGHTLEQLIGRKGLKLNETLKCAVQMADALARAHSGGIIHRDLKPSNVMVDEHGLVRLLDFGLAKLTEHGTSEDDSTVTVGVRTDAGMIVGTAAYMSPEQAEGKPLDERSDVFSFGSVLYEMVTGRRAFQRDTQVSTLAAILREEPKAVSQVGVEVPRDLEKVIIRCLRKERERRFQHMDDVRVALEELKVESESGTTAAREWLPRRRFAVGTGAAALLVIGGLAASWFIHRAKPLDSLAVLPFVNVGGDANTEYLSEGIAEGLINTLSQLPNFRVIARTTAFQYKGREADPQQVGRELRVRAVLTGKVTQRGDSLRIQADLVDSSDGSQLWGQQYNRKLSEIFEVQEEITKEISEKLRLRLTGEEKQRLARRHTESTEAYENYVKGRYHWSRRTPEALRRGIGYFERAIEKDPAYALAYSGLADSESLLPNHTRTRTGEVSQKARAAAEKALVIDDSLGEAHASLGFVLFRLYWEWERAEKEYQRSLQLNPGYATGHHWLGVLFSTLGRVEEALAEIRRAREVDPLSIGISVDVARALYLGRRCDEAIEEYRKTLEMDPSSPVTLTWLGAAYMQRGEHQQAIAVLQKALQLSAEDTYAAGLLGQAYAKAGQRNEALRILDSLKEQAKQQYVSAYAVAAVYTGLGDKGQALAWLGKAYEERAPWMHYAKVEPWLDSLRSDPSFQDLLRRMRLAP